MRVKYQDTGYRKEKIDHSRLGKPAEDGIEHFVSCLSVNFVTDPQYLRGDGLLLS